MLIALSGLPGVGKSTLARALATRLGAVWLRIDTIEQAMAEATGHVPQADEGYRVAYALAEDNLRLGLTVIADSVNPLAVTRGAWRAVAARAGVACVDVAVICSDPALHRRRVEARVGDIPGLTLPTWEEVLARVVEEWSQPPLVVDTAHRSVDDCAAQVLAALPKASRPM